MFDFAASRTCRALALLLCSIAGQSAASTASVSAGALSASDPEDFQRFGASISISGDTALVGAPGSPEGLARDVGAAYVFVRSGNHWVQQQKLLNPSGQDYDYFGGSVAISGDTALVSRSRCCSSQGAGEVFVFVRSGGTWTQQQVLTPTGFYAYSFGSAVAIDGDVAVVGDPDESDNGAGLELAGATYVFTRSGTTWTLLEKMLPEDRADNARFGIDIALKQNLAVVGADRANAAYIFVIAPGVGAYQQDKLTAPDGAAGDGFGAAVSLDGARVLIGAPGDDTAAGANAGSAYVFAHTGGGNWTQEQKLVASDGGAANALFGMAVALVGSSALVGSPHGYYDGAGGAGEDDGKAYLFSRSGVTWTPHQQPIAGVGKNLGASVALAEDKAFVGAPSYLFSGIQAVYIFQQMTALQNGQAVTGLTGVAGSDALFYIDVPAGASNLQFNLSGGAGDADLFVNKGSPPDIEGSDFDCTSQSGTSDEECAVTAAAGRWYALVKGYSTYSGVTVLGQYVAPPAPPAPSAEGGSGPLAWYVSLLLAFAGCWRQRRSRVARSYAQGLVFASTLFCGPVFAADAGFVDLGVAMESSTATLGGADEVKSEWEPRYYFGGALIPTDAGVAMDGYFSYTQTTTNTGEDGTGLDLQWDIMLSTGVFALGMGYYTAQATVGNDSQTTNALLITGGILKTFESGQHVMALVRVGPGTTSLDTLEESGDLIGAEAKYVVKFGPAGASIGVLWQEISLPTPFGEYLVTNTQLRLGLAF